MLLGRHARHAVTVGLTPLTRVFFLAWPCTAMASTVHAHHDLRYRLHLMASLYFAMHVARKSLKLSRHDPAYIHLPSTK